MTTSETTRRTLVAIYAAAVGLLAISMTIATLDLGIIGTGIQLLIAAVIAALVAMFFMRLRTAALLIRVVAVASLLWLTFMFTLTLADYLTR
jgi:cytochrome c oxidase subunit 4